MSEFLANQKRSISEDFFLSFKNSEQNVLLHFFVTIIDFQWKFSMLKTDNSLDAPKTLCTARLFSALVFMGEQKFAI
jgi:hypothetical protein